MNRLSAIRRLSAGTAANLAARRCAEASDGQILSSEAFLARLQARVRSQPVGELELKGLGHPIGIHNIMGLSSE